MKKFLSLIVAIALVVTMLPTAALAIWTSRPTVALSATELGVDNKMAVTITVAGATPTIKAYNLGICYDPDLVEVDATAGTYMGWNEETSYEDIPTGLDIANTTDNFQYNMAATTANKTMYFVTDASSRGFGNGFTVTVHFKLTDKAIAEGGRTNFEIASGVGTIEGTQVELFTINDGADGKADYPTENNSVSVAIPMKNVALTGGVTTPTKNGEDESHLTGTNVDATVTWKPALDDG